MRYRGNLTDQRRAQRVRGCLDVRYAREGLLETLTQALAACGFFIEPPAKPGASFNAAVARLDSGCKEIKIDPFKLELSNPNSCRGRATIRASGILPSAEYYASNGYHRPRPIKPADGSGDPDPVVFSGP